MAEDPVGEGTICVTGATGYVGRHLVARLAAAGRRVVVIGRRGPAGARPANLPSGAESIGPWSDAAELAERLAALGTPPVVNLAAHYLKTHEPSDVEDLVAGNVLFPAMIFEAVARAQPEGGARIVNVGTTWETAADGGPTNLYAALKAGAAAVLDWHVRASGLRAMHLRLNDTYGGADARPKLLPLLRTRARDGEVAELGWSEQGLDLLHIDDVTEGLARAVGLTADLAPGSLRRAVLMSGAPITVGGLVEAIRSGPAPDLKVRFRGAAPGDAPLPPPPSPEPRLPGWTPRVALADGLARYFEEDVA